MSKLHEIYLENDKENFTFGSILAETEELFIIETLDEKGQFDSIQLRPKANVGGFVSSSKYLELMEFNRRNHIENDIYNPLGLEINDENYSNLENAFHMMRDSKDIYTIVTDTYEEIYIGYIESVFEKEIFMHAINFEDFTQTEVSINKDEIVAIDILSYENALLQKFLNKSREVE
ncbi:hypothetical protein [Staphylococcus argensis]|uniref:Uncharacterized protein n=1 Tax=Staphylococcus argensis TaxID=1607738 RepID=A0A2K4FAI0_9STAP|nr:hypothetical protein [Staphylococcus argensis]MCY6991402.1 hypothetical protein [Staphylococcus argensis]POA08362.1 hypothetical protein CD039_09765 [Staphylococcus argensis]